MEPTTTSPEMSSNHADFQFHIADYVILVILLMMSMGIGAYHALRGGRQKTTKEYFKGNSQMGLIPVFLSLMASFISSNGMLGVPAEVYHQGFNYWFVNLGPILGIPLAAFFFLPVFYDLQITSVYDYLERRFNRSIRVCGSLLSIATMIVFASFVIYGPALALSQVTKLSLWGSILTTTIIGTVYTSIGGIKAVIWTDCMQMIVFTISLSLCIIKGTIDVGGFSTVISKALEGQRLQPLSFSFDPRIRFTFWGFFIATTIGWTYGYGVCQMQIQRYLSSPSKKAALKGLWLNFPGMVIVITTFCYLGLILYASYWDCDPTKSKQISRPDQIFPLFVMKTMNGWPGLPGLFVAGVFSASLSTISSILNSLAAITIEDHVRPYWKNLSDEKATNISKGFAVMYGFLCIGVVAGITNSGGIIETIMYVAGVTFGVEFGLFTMGFMIPWTNAKGAMIGMICGLGLSAWISLGNQITKPSITSLPVSTEGCYKVLGTWEPDDVVPTQTNSEDILEIYKISYLWITPIAWGTTVIIGSTLSLLFGNDRVVDLQLFSPPIRKLIQKKRASSAKDHLPNGNDVHLPCENGHAINSISSHDIMTRL